MDKMRKLHEGDTLMEVLQKQMDENQDKNVQQQILDSQYELVFENGITFNVRRTNLLRDQKICVKKEDKQ